MANECIWYMGAVLEDEPKELHDRHAMVRSEELDPDDKEEEQADRTHGRPLSVERIQVDLSSGLAVLERLVAQRRRHGRHLVEAVSAPQQSSMFLVMMRVTSCRSSFRRSRFDDAADCAVRESS